MRLRDWSLVREPDGCYAARIPAGEFALDLRFTPTQPVLLQGNAGLSRKGPDDSAGQLLLQRAAARGAAARITLQGQRLRRAAARAWLDHEWSEAYMHPEAVGWDWIGMNLDDGSALTAFRLRRTRRQRAVGRRLVPHGATARRAVFGTDEVRFEAAARRWNSPRTQASYPMRMARATRPPATSTVRGAARRPGTRQPRLDRRRCTGKA